MARDGRLDHPTDGREDDYAQGYLFSAPMDLEALQASNYIGVGRVS